MKISYVTAMGEIPSRKANSVSVMHMTSAFADAGADIQLVVPAGQHLTYEELSHPNHSPYDFYKVNDNFQLHYLPAPLFGTKVGYMLFALSAAMKGAKHQSDVYFCRNVEMAYIISLLGYNTVYDNHNYRKTKTKPFFNRWLSGLKSENGRTAVVTTTTEAADWYLQKGVLESNIYTHPNGVDIAKFQASEDKYQLREQFGLPSDRPIVVYSGHLMEAKGSRELIHCAALMSHVLFLLVGGEPHDIALCQKLAQEVGADNIRFEGFVSQSLVASYQQTADILVMPQSKAPNSAMKFFEYLAAGRPVVLTDFPTTREIYTHMRNGYLVEPQAPKALADGIQWFLDNPEKAEAFAAQAKEDALYYTWENRAETLLSWFSQRFQTQ